MLSLLVALTTALLWPYAAFAVPTPQNPNNETTSHDGQNRERKHGFFELAVDDGIPYLRNWSPPSKTCLITAKSHNDATFVGANYDAEITIFHYDPNRNTMASITNIDYTTYSWSPPTTHRGEDPCETFDYPTVQRRATLDDAMRALRGAGYGGVEWEEFTLTKLKDQEGPGSQVLYVFEERAAVNPRRVFYGTSTGEVVEGQLAIELGQKLDGMVALLSGNVTSVTYKAPTVGGGIPAGISTN